MPGLRPVLHVVGRPAALAGAYFLAARLGLTMSFVHGTVSPVWPPTGLAVASLALWGTRLWPAVAAGAFAANLIVAGHTPAVAAWIAVGNTLEALLGAWLLRRFGAAREPAATRDALVMVAVAAAAPLPSATGGVLTLLLAGFVGWGDLPEAWLVWWVGDALGALVVAPLILSWLGAPVVPGFVRRGETGACLATVAAASGIVFAGDEVWAGFGLGPIVFTPFLLPPLVWATFSGYGPFSLHSPVANLVRLQLMLASMGATLLILAAAITELKAAMRHAEEVSAIKSRFVAAVRHDLSQPLQAAQLFLSALAHTGPGIPPDQQDRIFEAFHRAGPAPSTSKDGGQGLGLATVRRLASLLGLTVAVRSVVGRGAVFSVVVPRG